MQPGRGAATLVFAALATLTSAASAQLLPTTTTTSTPSETTTTSCGIVECLVTTTTSTSTTSSSTSTTAESTTTSAEEPVMAAESTSLSISVPVSAVLGAADGGTQAQLGVVSVSVAGSLVPRAFTVTVSSTDFIGSNGGTVVNDLVSYASGPALAGTTAVVVPGQLTTAVAQPLSGEVTALTGTGGVASTTASWNPTIIVDVPTDLPAGDYHGTITHSAF